METAGGRPREVDIKSLEGLTAGRWGGAEGLNGTSSSDRVLKGDKDKEECLTVTDG